MRTVTLLGTSALVAGVLLSAACARKTTADTVTGATTVGQQAQQRPATGSAAMQASQRPATGSAVRNALPARFIYRMSGDYADLVPVTLDADGNIYSYPAPCDINESQKPVPLGDGWYLDRRGISKSSAFTDYTYEAYHALKSTPPTDTLKAHIKVPGGVTELWNCGTRRRSVEEYRQLVKDGFPGCTAQ